MGEPNVPTIEEYIETTLTERGTLGNPDLLNNEEKNYLNNYHHMVFKTIVPHLNEEERTWLLKYTHNI